jgi:hypothetical protein
VAAETFEVGDRVSTRVTGGTGVITGMDLSLSALVEWDDGSTPSWEPMSTLTKIRPRVGHDRFQPGDKVKYRAGRTKRASRVGEIERTGIDVDGGSFAVVVTTSGVTKDVDYDDLELIRRHERKGVPPTGTPKAITVSFSYIPDERIPFIRDLDDLIEILSEQPDNLTITE